MFKLRYQTPPAWVLTVLDDFNAFLIDHAGAEKKASGMAMSMALHYADKPDIVSAMIDLSIEELEHFREVVKLMAARQLQLQKDEKDPYVNKLRKQVRNGRDDYFLDRLLLGAVIEARGAERFGLVASALPLGASGEEDALKHFYEAITRSEDRHQNLFIELAENHFPAHLVSARLDELVDFEAALVETLPFRAALH
ncbi:MAG: tRNA-(ms[2]io[6]A)-hydroxylase [Gammaproteobacteria bacterium]|nr:tRNA-(ms[2]io[6]A)-hydroxylase [Gammaproteobacteria bacterium]MBQ0840841.1 tRNA-(ms[2]io[6]A)-hydroxylase [Gammaproteobacteria bacterium]